MRQLDCIIPVRVQITGTLDEERASDLQDSLAAAIQGRLQFAHKTLTEQLPSLPLLVTTSQRSGCPFHWIRTSVFLFQRLCEKRWRRASPGMPGRVILPSFWRTTNLRRREPPLDNERHGASKANTTSRSAFRIFCP